MEKTIAKSKGLGRGLDALLGGSAKNDTKDTLTELDVGKLQSGKYQPRTQMNESALQELSRSIKAQGIMQPILVRKIDRGAYEIIAGERRWRAAKMAGLAHVPVLIREVSNEAVAAMSLIENIQREDLNPLEEAYGLQRLIEEFHMTHEGAATAVGRSRSAVTNLLRLTHLVKPVQDMLMAGQIEMGHARALLGIQPEAQLELAREVVEKRLSVREVEKRVHNLNTFSPRVNKEKTADVDTTQLMEELSESLAATVNIQVGKKGAGRLVIEYASLDQLDDIIRRLKHSS